MSYLSLSLVGEFSAWVKVLGDDFNTELTPSGGKNCNGAPFNLNQYNNGFVQPEVTTTFQVISLLLRLLASCYVTGYPPHILLLSS